jgi:hypothetical protein
MNAMLTAGDQMGPDTDPTEGLGVMRASERARTLMA